MYLKKIVRQVICATGLRSFLLRFFSSEFRCNNRLVKVLKHEIMEAGFDKILHRIDEYPKHSRKYLVLDEYLEEAVLEARKLNLLHSSGLRVLDIGCGAGYFLYVLRKCGHDILGLDINDNIMYNEIIELLKIPRVTYRIEKFRPLPDLGEPFDLITAFSICFDCHGSENVWRADEWKFFIDDCLGHLRSDGRMFFCFNPATSHDFDFIPDEVSELLQKFPGAILSANKETFLMDRAENLLM